MTKIYIKKVDKCNECPEFEENDYPFGGVIEYTCTKKKKELILTDLEKTPKWCPLEEVKNGKKMFTL